MQSTNDYSRMTLEELTAEEKKVASERIMVSFAVGFLFGIGVFNAVNKGNFFLTLLLLFYAFQVGSRHSQKLNNIRAELSNRTAAA